MSFLSLFNCDGLPPRSHPSQLPSLAEHPPSMALSQGSQIKENFPPVLRGYQVVANLHPDSLEIPAKC